MRIPRPKYDIADIVRQHRVALEARHPLSAAQGRVLSAIVLCRTAELGGHVDICLICGSEHPSYNSCRNRHCPKCQALAQEEWIQKRAAVILPIRHFHGVFTLPEELRPLAKARSREVYDAMFKAVRDTLLELGRSRRKTTLGLTMVLHTWRRDLGFHPHIHVLITAGGLSLDGQSFVRIKAKFLLHVKVIGKLFKGKMMDRLRGLQAKGSLGLTPGAFGGLMAKLADKDWNVHVKKAFRRAEDVLAYLGRYTHRVGIANSRLLDVGDEHVTFRTKDGRSVTLDPVEFLRRFVQHVLPDRFHKIRHGGLYASPKALAQARERLGVPPAVPAKPTVPEENPLPTCPQCGGQLRRVEIPKTLQSRRPRSPP